MKIAEFVLEVSDEEEDGVGEDKKEECSADVFDEVKFWMILIGRMKFRRKEWDGEQTGEGNGEGGFVVVCADERNPAEYKYNDGDECDFDEDEHVGWGRSVG